METSALATAPKLPGLEGMVPTAGKLPGNAGIPAQSPVKPVSVYEAQAYSNLTPEQRRHFRALIDGGATPADQQRARYERYVANWKADPIRGSKPVPTMADWAPSAARARTNKSQGTTQEAAALKALGLTNNNFGNSVIATVMDPKTGRNVTIRPDSMDGAVVDVKGMSGKETRLSDSEQLRGERELALQNNMAAAVIIVSPDAKYQPSATVAGQSVVIRYDPNSGTFSAWDRRLNGGKGGYAPTTKEEVLDQFQQNKPDPTR